MGHFVGKINLSALAGFKIADVRIDNEEKKCILLPIKDNNIIHYGEEWQLWFRAFAYRTPKSRFSHFLMNFIPRSQIKKMSASQLEMFANHSIGGMMRSGYNSDSPAEEFDTDDFIKNNI